MNRVFHFHPLSSFSHKALIGLYDCDVAFDKHIVQLNEAESRAAFYALNPLGKMPVLVDDGTAVCESSIILEHACPQLFPSLEARYWDRFFDLYLHHPMQRMVAENFRPEGSKDPFGVTEAKANVEKAYKLADEQLRGKKWAIGDQFTIADCAAAPPLFYAGKMLPFTRFEHLSAYFERLKARPSYARVLEEAAPYMKMFPGSG